MTIDYVVWLDMLVVLLSTALMEADFNGMLFAFCALIRVISRREEPALLYVNAKCTFVFVLFSVFLSKCYFRCFMF